MTTVAIQRSTDLIGRATELLGENYKPNKYGHDRKHLRFIMSSSPYKDGTAHDEFGHNRKSHAVYAICEKIRNFGANPLAFPEIGYTKVKYFVKKHGDWKQQLNSQMREKIVNTAIYLVNHASFISGVVGIRGYGKHGEFKCFDTEHAQRVTGMDYDQIKVAVRWMEEHEMLERQRTWVEKEDGSYGGRPSIYRLTDKFWVKFRCMDLFEELRAFTYKKALESLGNSIKRIAASLSTAIPDDVKTALGIAKRKKSPRLKSSDWTEENIQFWLSKLPKPKHHAFQVHFAEIYQAAIEDGEPPPIRQILKSAFKSFTAI